MDVKIERIEPEGPYYAAERRLRYELLRRALGMAEGTEEFPFERESLHFVAVQSGEVVGCVMFHPESEIEGRLLQMAVAERLQGSGLGRQLVVALEEEVRRRGGELVTLHARAPVTGFYAKLGYEAFGEPYEELGIGHQMMRKRL